MVWPIATGDANSARTAIGGLRLDSQHLVTLQPFVSVRRKNLIQRPWMTAYRKALLTLSTLCSPSRAERMNDRSRHRVDRCPKKGMAAVEGEAAEGGQKVLREPSGGLPKYRYTLST